MSEVTRCDWATTDLLRRYHDEEWGVPVYDDRTLFEFLCLEGAQAGLSWETILKKREGYRHAFDGFDPDLVARYEEPKVAELLADSGIIRNRAKITAIIQNARAMLAIGDVYGSFARYIWRFSPGYQEGVQSASESPQPPTALSNAMSKDLKRRGFGFVGPTICYAFMQATGMVNDHDQMCFRRIEVQMHPGVRSYNQLVH